MLFVLSWGEPVSGGGVSFDCDCGDAGEGGGGGVSDDSGI